MTFTLRDFQDEAVIALREAAAGWVAALAEHGPPRSGRQVIPMLAQLRAITGAGKTPILTATIAGLGPSIVFWTTKSSVLVGQTIQKLNTVYRGLLPPDTTILKEIPSPSEWTAMLADTTGTTIWVRTVASWNESEEGNRGTDDARLNLHRPAADWAGPRSPWDVLADRNERHRPLWVVYDEGHGQTSVQLDQLTDLKPVGIFAATATPVRSERVDRYLAILSDDEVFGPIAREANVQVSTAAVARAGLLKTTVRVTDLDVDAADKVEHVVDQLRRLDQLGAESSAPVRPRALYIVEESNLRRGHTGDPPPVVIWRALVERLRVPADTVAMATDTRDAPKDAEQITTFAGLKARHRHVIFNKKLQEGWDDPEAYIAYFDGETNSALRLKQLIGRVVRQPDGKHLSVAELNTAYLFVSSPNRRFARVVEDLQKSLVDEYGAEAGEPTIKVETGPAPAAISPRPGLPKLGVPRWTLGGAVLTDAWDDLRSAGGRDFPQSDLDAPGVLHAKTFDIDDEDDRAIADEAVRVGNNIRTANGRYVQERIGALSRAALNALHQQADVLAGSMWAERSSTGSTAQREIARLARDYVDAYETRVRYIDWPNPFEATWKPEPYTPRSGSTRAFEHSVHPYYPTARAVFNADELEVAVALDAIEDGLWARNFTSAANNGYWLPLPAQVDGSNRFFADFLWWIDGRRYAIETSGRHLLASKVRGKLLSLSDPAIALIARGRVAASWSRNESAEGWTLVRARPGAASATPEHYPDLATLLAQLRGTEAIGGDGVSASAPPGSGGA